jgi:FdhD protein
MNDPGLRASSKSIEIDKVRGTTRTRRSDDVAVEEPLEIQIGASNAAGSAAKSVSITMRTPGDDIDLSLGFLAGESIIKHRKDVAKVAHVGPVAADSGLRNSVRIELNPDVDIDLARLERHFYTTSSCGVCGKTSLDALRVGAPPASTATFSIAQDRLIGLVAKLRERQRVFQTTGGLHAAAAFDSRGDLLLVREDVGRHNAVDKVIGALFAEGSLPADNLGILVSGRASFELMQKTLVAGMQMLVAVSAPSSLAVELAREFDLTLVGFLRESDFNVYSGANRITE